MESSSSITTTTSSSASSTQSARSSIATLQRAVADDNHQLIIDQLDFLMLDNSMTEDLLRESKGGVTAGKLRKHANSSISSLAAKVVSKWRAQVEDQKKRKVASADVSSESQGPSKRKKSSSAKMAEDSHTTASTASLSPLPGPADYQSIILPYPDPPRTFKTDGAKAAGTGDNVRDKSIELVYDALAGDSRAESSIIMARARSIESGVFVTHDSQTDNLYRQKMRSLCTNLKDKNDPALRDAVVQGDVEATSLASMTKDEMASSRLTALKKKLEVENLFNSRGAQQVHAETDQFKCGRCQARKATYYQMQTRSADEPMTTFVTCLNCDNRWKFS